MSSYDNINESQIREVSEFCNVSHETLAILDSYMSELKKWNNTINLISKKTIANDLFYRHILDSLQLIRHLEGECLTDLGAGSGLPSIPLSIMSGIKASLIESDKRKAAFLNNIKAKFNLPIFVITDRVEKTTIKDREITSRAFASVEKTFELLSKKNKLSDKKLVLLKGEKVNTEIIKAKDKWVFNSQIYNSSTHEGASILVISNIEQKQSGKVK